MLLLPSVVDKAVMVVRVYIFCLDHGSTFGSLVRGRSSDAGGEHRVSFLEAHIHRSSEDWESLAGGDQSDWVGYI